MSNTLANPSAEFPSRDIGMFYVEGMQPDNNPAAEARAEYLQHEYAESLVTPDPADAVQHAAAEVDSIYTAGVFNDRHGNAIDPAHSEAPLQQAAEVVNNTAEAISRAQVYGPMLENLRRGAEQSWGAETTR